MNNPGMDFEIWKQLRQKWTELDAKGHKIKVDFQLVTHPTEKNNVLAIDVIQHIDGKPVTETVQKNAGEGYAPLGIAGLSMDHLIEVYKGMMQELGLQSKLKDGAVTVTMECTSATSGQLIGRLELFDAPVQSQIIVNYQHYYVLNALRDRMIDLLGERWSQVRAVYYEGNLDFHFDYS